MRQLPPGLRGWSRGVVVTWVLCCRCLLQRLLPFTQYEASAVRRGGIVGTLRNCCFDHCKLEITEKQDQNWIKGVFRQEEEVLRQEEEEAWGRNQDGSK